MGDAKAVSSMDLELLFNGPGLIFTALTMMFENYDNEVKKRKAKNDRDDMDQGVTNIKL